MLVLMHGLKYVPQSFGDLPGDGNLKQSRTEAGSRQRGREGFDSTIISGETPSCQDFCSSESTSTQLARNLISCVSSQGDSVCCGI